MRQYQIVAPGFVVLTLTLGRGQTRQLGLLTASGRDIPLNRLQSAELLRNARIKGYSVKRTI